MNTQEQFIYVSPPIPQNINALPKKYKDFMKSKKGKDFINKFFPDLQGYALDILDHRFPKPRAAIKVSCKGARYLSKCHLEGDQEHTDSYDKEFFAVLRKNVR